LLVWSCEENSMLNIVSRYQRVESLARLYEVAFELSDFFIVSRTKAGTILEDDYLMERSAI